MAERIIRVLLCKTTMECHDRGVRYLATKLRDAGMEVVFINFLEPREIIETAIDEDVDVIGVSSSVEGHLPVAREITKRLEEQGIGDVLVVFGGVIPERDVAPMKEMGVKEVFGPGSSADEVIAYIRANARERSFEVE
ncbi:MAG: cobalamin-dependent protein [Betaproteobacteria bacterium]|jgi:methylmalonyl-CoA mutase C-terminal domain/subunit|nr:cobalamin-dependent protein [Betaproteobacteria bacterium]